MQRLETKSHTVRYVTLFIYLEHEVLLLSTQATPRTVHMSLATFQLAACYWKRQWKGTNRFKLAPVGIQEDDVALECVERSAPGNGYSTVSASKSLPAPPVALVALNNLRY